MYEEWGLIQTPKRKSNGYRIFSDIHIEQFQLAKKAFQIPILQAGLRKKIISAVKYSAQYDFENAIKCTKDYIATAEQETKNAIEATAIVDALFGTDEQRTIEQQAHEQQAYCQECVQQECVQMKRAEVANKLGLTIDTIRNWEMNGLLNVKRKKNGYRVYDAADIKKLKVIRTLRCANYSLSAILRMMNALEHKQDRINALELLNTTEENEDDKIVEACDQLVISLNGAIENAKEVLALLERMKEKY